MALRDQPYLPLYVQDFLTDEKLMECSASATGIYIRIMCIMHKSDVYGTILLRQKDRQTDQQIKNFGIKLAKYLPYSSEEISNALCELINEDVLQIEDDKLLQKRMVRDNKISFARAEAGSKGGFAKANKIANTQANTEDETETYILLFKKVLAKNEVSLPDGFDSLILEWLKYKSEKGQSYKETGLKTLIKTFLKDSNSDIKTGREMLDYSMSKNYSGLFKEKINGKHSNDYNGIKANDPSIYCGRE